MFDKSLSIKFKSFIFFNITYFYKLFLKFKDYSSKEIIFPIKKENILILMKYLDKVNIVNN
jgi:hypothetical protein